MRNSIILSAALLGASAIALPHVGHYHKVRDMQETWTAGNDVYVEDIAVVTATLSSGQVPPVPSPVSPSPPALGYHENIARPTGPAQIQQEQQAPPVVVSSSPSAPVSTEAPVAQNNPAPSPSTVAQAGSGSGSGSGTNTGPVPGPSNIPTTGGPTWVTSPNSMGKSILGTANYWRNKWNPELGPFVWDETLAANARSTAIDPITTTVNAQGETVSENEGGANQMNHMLNPGSMGQCINEGDGVTMNGDLTPFENAWLGWICERANGNVPCDQIAEYKNGYAIDKNTGKPDTGHADIIGGQYTKVGCYYQDGTENPKFVGMYTCDFA